MVKPNEGAPISENRYFLNSVTFSKDGGLILNQALAWFKKHEPPKVAAIKKVLIELPFSKSPPLCQRRELDGLISKSSPFCKGRQRGMLAENSYKRARRFDTPLCVPRTCMLPQPTTASKAEGLPSDNGSVAIEQ